MDGTMTNLPLFKHSPLKLKDRGIRVVELIEKGLPGRPAIRCRVSSQLIDDNAYTALSYNWGPPESGIPIEINGGIFFVRQNLFDFLEHADIAGQLFWIDAICIDQLDTYERNHQVQLMHQIYSHAESVLIWLGSGDEDITGALQSTAAEHEANDAREQLSFAEEDTLLPSTRYMGVGFGRMRAGAKQLSELFFWPNYQVLCSLPYWTRAWILQEVVLNDNVMLQYGHARCCWRCFAEVIQRGFDAASPRHLHGSPAYHVFTLKQSLDGPAPVRDLPFILSRSTQSACSDAHDKIFGILGLVKFVEPFPVDYTQSLQELAVTTALLYITYREGGYGRSSKETKPLGRILDDFILKENLAHEAQTFRAERLPPPQALDLRVAIERCEWPYHVDHPFLGSGEQYTDLRDMQYRADLLSRQCQELGNICYYSEEPAPFDKKTAHVIVTREIQGCERVIARAYDRSRLNSESRLELYNASKGLAHGLPGAKLDETRRVLRLDNTYTAAILLGMPEDVNIRQRCVPAMIDRLLKWQQEGANYSKSSSN